jgi:hypothetical protein
LVYRDELQVLLTLAQQYVSEAAAIIRRQEQLIEQLNHQPGDAKATEALAQTFQAAASAMARHQRSIERLRGNLSKGRSSC